MSASITATLKTWHPDSQTERTIKVARFPHSHDPDVLLRRAAELLPRLRPRAMRLVFTETLFFEVSFGTDRKGTQWSVWFPLLDSKYHPQFIYLMLRGRELIHLLAGVSLPDDGDGGETLTVPKLAAEAFNAPISAALH